MTTFAAVDYRCVRHRGSDWRGERFNRFDGYLTPQIHELLSSLVLLKNSAPLYTQERLRCLWGEV